MQKLLIFPIILLFHPNNEDRQDLNIEQRKLSRQGIKIVLSQRQRVRIGTIKTTHLHQHPFKTEHVFTLYIFIVVCMKEAVQTIQVDYGIW